MSGAGCRVLVVDHDVDALSDLAAELRRRGVRVSLANGAKMAVERAKASSFDVIVVAREAASPSDGSLGVLDALGLELLVIPPAIVLEDGPSSHDGSVPRGDVDRLVARIGSLAKGDALRAPSMSAPSAHAIEEGTAGDLLLLLGSERRSGTVTVSTPRATGEVRLEQGEIVDAVFGRLEGAKALARIVELHEGSLTFTQCAPPVLRRMHGETKELVAAARRSNTRSRALLGEAGTLATGLFVAQEPGARAGQTAAEELVLGALRAPASLETLLDAVPLPDAEALEALLAVDTRGAVRHLGELRSRVVLCGEDQLHVMRASASRARAAGFTGAARVVVAATPARLAVFAHTVQSLADAVPAAEPALALPVPHELAELRLGDGVTLDVDGLPLVPAYAPLWPQALAGAAVVIRLDEGARAALEAASRSVDVAVFDARSALPSFDETSGTDVATILRAALDADPS